MSLRDDFEKHVEATSVCWVEEMRSRLFDRNKVGQYTWQGLESRFADFQAGHAAGLEAARPRCLSLCDKHKNMTYTIRAGYSAPLKEVCPICEPPPSP